MSISGDDCTVCLNTIRNIDFGISVTGERALVQPNTIDSFAGDGLRGIGDYGTFEYKTVTT